MLWSSLRRRVGQERRWVAGLHQVVVEAHLLGDTSVKLFRIT